MAKPYILPLSDPRDRLDMAARVRAWNQVHVAAGHSARAAFILTLGCQQNEADSEKLAGMAVEMGYRLTDNAEEADLILVNTCAIREHAERRALSLIGGYKHIREKNPDLIIGVCGCMTAQAHRRDQLKKSYPYVTFTLGTASLHHLPRVLWDTISSRRRLMTQDTEEDFTRTVAEGAPIHRASTYRAWVSVMYGCNNFCSYCIVPYVRGRERSRAPEDILAEVRELVAAGYREITLLGQNVNSYGKGTDCDFAELLRRLDEIPGDYRLTFMTSHPKDASRRLIDVMAEGKHIAHRFHLPLQSGSDRILAAMNRHYDLPRYRETVRYLRKRLPDVVLTSDIIVGFPGETEEDFSETLAAISEFRYDMLYSFIYSPRKGTPAAEMPPVPDEDKQARFARLLELQNRLAAASNAPMVGKTVRVLCDGPKEEGTQENCAPVLTGRTEGNKPVTIHLAGDTASADSAAYTGRFVSVRITRADSYTLSGELVSLDEHI